MALGIPDNPSPDLDFTESPDDETCPTCGWDTEPALMDHNASHNMGVLLAAELAEGSPFQSMGGTQLVGFYFRCPRCGTYFTTEEEAHLGAMT